MTAEPMLMRHNRTQAALAAASDVRAYSAAVAAIAIRERIPPIRNRQLAKLAAIVAASPINPPRRRARRDGRK